MINKQNLLSIFAFSALLFVTTPYAESSEPDNDTSLFRQKGIIRLTLEETIPENCQKKGELITSLRSSQLTNVPTEVEPGIKKEVGYTFPNTAPWCLLAAKYIKSFRGNRPNLGDWGCGNGFFSRHAVIAGANPFAIDSSLPAANEANRTIYKTGSYLPDGLDIKELYKVSHASVVNPGPVFMNRKNHVNVAFNVIHYLSPCDADLLLNNLFKNTENNGILILCCDTPFDSNNVAGVYYQEGKKLGLKYPGYGIYSKSTIVYLDDQKNKNYLTRSVYRPTAKDEKAEKFKMGCIYGGIYPVTNDYKLDNGQTLKVTQEFPNTHALNILKDSRRPYCFSTGHQAFNRFDYPGLKNVVELAGFSVLNGWYTDHWLNDLYPYDHEGPEEIRKSKVVLVAQKK